VQRPTGGYTCHTYQPPVARGLHGLWEKEEPLLVEWLQSLPKPVGVMTCNDDRGQHVLDACHAAKIHVPGEVGIIGVDNDEFICRLANPPLSSICLNPEKLGYQAAQLLDHVMREKTMDETTVRGEPTHVTARSLTNVLLVEDKDMAEALRFIREHADVPLQVDEVADAIGVSRRTLQHRFSRTVGRSIPARLLESKEALVRRAEERGIGRPGQ
jgi:LacI family transcriptional regulator